MEKYLGILAGGEGVSDYQKASAAYLLGRVAPKSEKVEKALRAAAASDVETVKRRAEYALKAYLSRTSPRSTGKR